MIRIEEFYRNPRVTGVIRSSTGYLYGICARRLYFASQLNRIDTAPKEVFANGIREHEFAQNEIYPEFEHEKTIAKYFEKPIGGIWKVSATLDCFSVDKVVEIKPQYKSWGLGHSMPAYVQTLIERFVTNPIPLFIYAYREHKEFLIEAKYEMAKVYLARIITALNEIPPRIPNANPEARPCSECAFQKRCWKMNSSYDQGTKQSWNEFSKKVEPFYEKVKTL